LVDLVTDNERDGEEVDVEILELPPVPVVDLVTDDEGDSEGEKNPIVDLIFEEEEEFVPPMTPPLEEIPPVVDEIESRDTSEDTESDGLTLSLEESREQARARGKWVCTMVGYECLLSGPVLSLALALSDPVSLILVVMRVIGRWVPLRGLEDFGVDD
jgi:hypothetical protein